MKFKRNQFSFLSRLISHVNNIKIRNDICMRFYVQIKRMKEWDLKDEFENIIDNYEQNVVRAKWL